MDGQEIVWLIAVGWVILSWIMKAIKGAVGQANTQGQLEEPDQKPDAGELRERRARLRAERARRRLSKSGPANAGLDDLRRELERVMGVHVEEEHGPAGRRSTVRLEPAEEVEEVESLEEEPVVVSMDEGVTERAPREHFDQDSQAAEIVRRRYAVAEAHSRPLTRADHQRFDEKIRSAPATVTASAQYSAVAGRPNLQKAFIWAEVLGKPVSLREDS